MADGTTTQAAAESTDISDKGPRGSFVRWQAYTIAQLTIATNLVLGLSVAVLGYFVALMLNLNGTLQPNSLLPRLGLLISLFCIGASISLGIWLVINRMGSFRATARVARMREQNRADPEIEPYRAHYRAFDRRTWPLFWSQLGTFAAGIALAFLSIVLPAAYRFLPGAIG